MAEGLVPVNGNISLYSSPLLTFLPEDVALGFEVSNFERPPNPGF
jgi:hypothetical protein